MSDQRASAPPRAKRARPRSVPAMADMQKHVPLIVIATMLVALAVVYFVYDIFARAPSCDQLFEQTASRFDGNLAAGKISVAFTLGRQGLQKIDDRNQKVAIHLKNCCITRQLGGISESRFQRCVDGADQYEDQIVRLVANSKEAKAASDRHDFKVAAVKTAAAQQHANEAEAKEAAVGDAAKNPLPSQRGAEASEAAEQEPNDTIFQANAVAVGQSVSGEISMADDVDFFKFHYDGNLRDRVAIRLENPSPSLRPALTQFDHAKNQVEEYYASTSGADLEAAISVEPGADFYLRVAGRSGSTGAYKLSAIALKAFDRYEPNDDAFHATPISPGQALEANIMDGADVDFYRVGDITGAKITVHIENASLTLKPAVEVFNSAKQHVTDNYYTTPGADLDLSFEAQPGKPSYIKVSGSQESSGGYRLSVEQQ